MSHTPPERDDDSSAPGGSGNSYVRLIMSAVLAFVLYVLSIGPAWWLLNHDQDSRKTFNLVYLPFDYLPPGLLGPVQAYMELWAPLW